MSRHPVLILILRLCRAGLVCLFAAPLAIFAQANPAAPCGVVDALDYPIDIRDTLETSFDDFSRYRQRFGGLHVGIDLGFRRRGEPVRAAARGRVTYANPEGWDTEKGVVIIEHVFPDGRIYYSLYGHLEPTAQFRFPLEGACVERGDIVGSIGDPSLSAPHLHYEIRNFLPNDGGPGYVSTNPLTQGWQHPLDFTLRWRLALLPGFIGAVSLDHVPDVPPVLLDSGVVVSARADSVAAFMPPGDLLWRVTTDGVVTGLAALPGDRVVAQTDSGQVVALQNGRYLALWTVQSLPIPFVVWGDNLVFVMADGGLLATTALGAPLWSLPGSGAPDRVFHFEVHEDTLGVGLRGGSRFDWRSISSDGTVIYATQLAPNPVVAPNPLGGWLLLEGASLDRIVGNERWTLGTTGQLPGRGARMTVDLLGSSYIFLGDVDSTLLSLDAQGALRWRIRYPYAVDAPLLDTGNGCLLYTLDSDGMVNMFNTADGALVNQVQLYAGGARTASPAARLLVVDLRDQVQVGAGFLTVALLDGVALNSRAAASCWLG